MFNASMLTQSRRSLSKDVNHFQAACKHTVLTVSHKYTSNRKPCFMEGIERDCVPGEPPPCHDDNQEVGGNQAHP